MNDFDISVTVSAIIEKNGKFLMVEEMASGERVINQPAGHLDDKESLEEAVVREVLEETGLDFTPTDVVGIYRWRQDTTSRTWLRFLFTGDVTADTPSPRDPVILHATWMTEAEIRNGPLSIRSPQVLQSLKDYLMGHRFPLSIINDLDNSKQ